MTVYLQDELSSLRSEEEQLKEQMPDLVQEQLSKVG